MKIELAATGIAAEEHAATTVIPNVSTAVPVPDAAVYAVTVIEPTAEAVRTGEPSVDTDPEVRVFASSDTEFVDADVQVAGPEITKEPVPSEVELKVRLAPTWITVFVLTADVILASRAAGSIAQTPAAASEFAAAGAMNTAFFVSTPALADGTATTESSPAPSADTATSAMRLRSVFVDMFFLSLVEFEYFSDSARRSFDLLIPFLL
jgi:hypothetical protein